MEKKQNNTCDVEGCVFEKTSTAQTHRHCQEFSLMKPIKGLCCRVNATLLQASFEGIELHIFILLGTQTVKPYGVLVFSFFRKYLICIQSTWLLDLLVRLITCRVNFISKITRSRIISFRLDAIQLEMWKQNRGTIPEILLWFRQVSWNNGMLIPVYICMPFFTNTNLKHSTGPQLKNVYKAKNSTITPPTTDLTPENRPFKKKIPNFEIIIFRFHVQPWGAYHNSYTWAIKAFFFGGWRFPFGGSKPLTAFRGNGWPSTVFGRVVMVIVLDLQNNGRRKVQLSTFTDCTYIWYMIQH